MKKHERENNNEAQDIVEEIHEETNKYRTEETHKERNTYEINNATKHIQKWRQRTQPNKKTEGTKVIKNKITIKR